VRLLYYAVAVCVRNTSCIFVAHQDRHVIALEVKTSLLLELLVPSSLDQPPRTNDVGWRPFESAVREPSAYLFIWFQARV
jgi:hypothetical protein